MEKGNETEMPMNKRAAAYLAGHREEIMDSLLDLRDENRNSKIIQEVQSLGGMGTISTTIGLFEDFADQNEPTISSVNASFIVAVLQSLSIRNYLADHSKGHLRSRDLEELRDYFLNQV